MMGGSWSHSCSDTYLMFSRLSSQEPASDVTSLMKWVHSKCDDGVAEVLWGTAHRTRALGKQQIFTLKQICYICNCNPYEMMNP